MSTSKNNESVKSNYIIKKPNPVLLMRDEMTIMQARFFSAYLSKIDPMDKSTYTVRFTLKSFYATAKIVDRRNRTELEHTLNGMVNMLVDFSKYIEKSPSKDHIFAKKRHLFEGYDLYQDKNGEYYVDVIPSNTLVKLIQGNYGYITPKLQYELPLSAKKHMRLYDFFYQFKNKEIVTISIENLKTYLGMDQTDYPQYKIFNRDVIKKGVDEINAKTDLLIEYEPIKRGNKVVQLKFVIKENPNCEPLSFAINDEQILFDDESPLNSYRLPETADDFELDDELNDSIT